MKQRKKMVKIISVKKMWRKKTEKNKIKDGNKQEEKNR